MANYAVLVGVSNYYDPQIIDLPHAGFSIRRLSEVLVAKGEFELSKMLLIADDHEGNDYLKMPYKFPVISTLLDLAHKWPIQKDDFLLFYFIGHGYGSVKGDQILLKDTCFRYLEETALSVGVLTKLVRPIRAMRKLLAFDSCRNEVEGTLGTHESLGKSRIDEFITLYACKPGELAYIPYNDKLPLLTSAFIDAVEDKNCLSIGNMYNLVCDKVNARSSQIAAWQTPDLCAGGKELDSIGFLSRAPRNVPDVPEGSGFEQEIILTNQALHLLYKEKYPHHAPSYAPFMNAAKELKNWQQKLDRKTFRKVAFNLLGKGENADVYTVSYMVRWGSDATMFRPLIESLAAEKYRGTVVWQALDALEVILRNEQVAKWLTVDEELKAILIKALSRSAGEHPTRKGQPFAPSVVWGKILQICKRADVPFQSVFSPEALAQL
ncbi:caspase family protein [Gaoshiqia sediminis]|uniref:Caspase family protein n=1 Tax=Gaoshiqia sediminis TaxID=2986998 RepID=A0AA42C733_9BACT|nr:caspase family protein [Gaoshiqia sediminis]MCW0484578.1 caspase family protein [Gaoshiqia sediminis]